MNEEGRQTNNPRPPSAAPPPPSPGFVQRVLVSVGIVIAAVLILSLIWFTVRVWLVLFAGILLAIFLHTLSTWVAAHTRIPPKWALPAVVVTSLGLAALGGWLLAPAITEQFKELAQRLPEAMDRLWRQVEDRGLMRWLPAEMPPASELASAVGNIAGRIAPFFRVTLEVIVGFVVIAFLGLYMAANPQTYIDGFIQVFPVRRRQRLREVFGEMACAIRYWLLGQLASMLAVGTLIGIGLYFVGVPLPLALGIIAGVLEFIPIFGPIAAAVPAALLGFTQSPMHALYAIIVFIVANQIESNLIFPLAQRYALLLPPALTLLALTLGGALFGFMGLLLATPITAVAIVLVKRLYVEDVLGDDAGNGRCGPG